MGLPRMKPWATLNRGGKRKGANNTYWGGAVKIRRTRKTVMLVEESFWSSQEPHRHRAVQRLRKERALSSLASRCSRTVSTKAREWKPGFRGPSSAWMEGAQGGSKSVQWSLSLKPRGGVRQKLLYNRVEDVLPPPEHTLWTSTCPGFN